MSISFVQANDNGAFSTSAPLSGVTVGNLLLVWGRFFGVGSAPTLTDTAGNTWVLASSFTNGSSLCALWYCLAASATTANVNMSAGAGSFPEFVTYEYSATGGATWSIGATPIHSTGSQSSPTWTTSARTVSVGDLVLGCFENETTNSITFSNAGGFTKRHDSQGNAVISDKVAASTSETPQIGSNTTATVGWMTANFTATVPATGRRISFID